MSNNSMLKIAGCVFAALFMSACAGKPVVDVDGQTGSASNRGGNGSQTTDPNGNGGSPVQITTGQAGNSVNGIPCKTSCNPTECGPVSNQCGGFIECGGCTAPEICGGSGFPSVCGIAAPMCIPMVCATLGKNCGLQSDGCGGIVDCWSEAAKASGTTPSCEVPGELCIDGTCKSAAPVCKKLTCNDYSGNANLCGPVSDGCGGTLDCGFACPTDQVCGLLEPGKCDKVVCLPQTCESALAGKPAGFCGIAPDGCGGIVQNCVASCTGADTCGGGGTADVCGHGAPVCVPLTSSSCGNSCGQISDGCGGFIQCATCQGTATCGGGGEPGVCGAPVCQPRTCASLNAECGSVTDGCGATLNCGSCTAPESCGGGGTPNVCGAPVCVPKTALQICSGGMCGTQSDGCGGTVDCGGCTAPNSCGGGGTPSVCGAPACTKRTCAQVGANCGPISDGCGGIIESCGTCTGTDSCGAVSPSVCGTAIDPNCTGLCPKIDWTCPAGQETRLTGKVYAPNGSLPLYNALVYVPNATLPAITTGATCERCENEDLGKPIAAALTGPDGAFVLRNVPAGVAFPLVVKMGKWRRVVTIPAVTRCTNVNLTTEQSRLPKNMADASSANAGYINIPHLALVTGQVDAIECVMRKIGVSSTEFTLPTGNGRIHMYRANGGTMGCKRFRTGSTTRCASSADGDVTQAPLSSLFAVANGKTKLSEYDIGVFDCEGGANEHNGYDAALRTWANAGGRVFASHYSYTYLHDNGDFANSAAWGGPQKGNGDSTTGILDTSFPKGQAFNNWLGNVGAWHATYGSGYIGITDPREYVKSAATGTERFIYADAAARIGTTQINQTSAVEQYSFNTPWGASPSNICGRVLYSAFHVAGASGLGDDVFPSYCSTAALTPQEKVLAFMIFDLSACVSVGEPPKPPTCTPKSCVQMAATCGKVADGCGGLLDCGTCTSPLSCGGGGVPNQCGNFCTRTTCGAQGANCGIIADGCGGTLECGACTAPAICGGGGTPNVCGTPACTPRSCTAVGAECGAISDGCGGTLECGTCIAPATCGGGGTPNVCGTGTCAPGTCGTAKCGFVGDGCGGTVSCGTCLTGQTCVAGACTGGMCIKRTCASASATCGFIGDGCGGVLDCGDCTAPQICGGSGVPSQCGGTCTARSCAAANAACGAISDGCGGIKSCGACPPGQTCGGGGVANQCGSGTCTPRTCLAANAECGSVGDGCGGVLECGVCVAPESCGGAGVANQCGAGGCVPLTCVQQGANCGPAADGCGGLLDCGSCVSPQTCGGGGIASQCGGTILM